MIEKEQVERIIEQTEGAKVIKAFAPDAIGGQRGKIAIDAGEGKEVELDVHVAHNYPFKVM